MLRKKSSSTPPPLWAGLAEMCTVQGSGEEGSMRKVWRAVAGTVMRPVEAEAVVSTPSRVKMKRLREGGLVHFGFYHPA